eukprot:1799263-Prymnesium_polylepis.1
MGVCTFLKRRGACTSLKVRTLPTLAERVAVALVPRSHHVEVSAGDPPSGEILRVSPSPPWGRPPC